MNLYLNFIESAKTKKYVHYFSFTENKEEKLERHRILPGFRGGTYDPKNIVWLSRSDHATAHKLRWKTERDIQDLIAWLYMTNKPKTAQFFFISIFTRKKDLFVLQQSHTKKEW